MPICDEEFRSVRRQIEKIVDKSKDTKEVASSGPSGYQKTSDSSRKTLVAGDLELEHFIYVQSSGYCVNNVTAKYRKVVVFADRQEKVYIKGEWEDHLAQLESQLSA